MKRIFILFTLYFICHSSFCAEFVPTEYPELSAKIFYINAQQAVLYVSADHYNQNGMGFDEFELRNSFHKYQQKNKSHVGNDKRNCAAFASCYSFANG